MQIKSWQIALVGTLAQILILVWYTFGFIILAIPGILSTLLLYFEKTRYFGAKVSLLFGIMPFIISSVALNKTEFLFISKLELPILLAGVYYFWKKV